MENENHDKNLQERDILYERTINEVLVGQYDKALMEEILNEVSGDISKAQALYVYRICNAKMDKLNP